MPQGSLEYAVARVKVREGRLLSAERLERMVDAPSADDALRLLGETGYGAQGDGDYEKMAEWELEQAAEFIEAITPDEEMTDLFLMHGDFQNLKAAFKMRALDLKESPALTRVCKVPPEDVMEMVLQRNFYSLPECMRAVAERCETMLAGGMDPRRLDMALDAAYLRWAVQSSGKRGGFVADYFAQMVDFYNAAIVLRAPGMGEGLDFVRENLLEGGLLDKGLLVALFNRESDAQNRLSGRDKNFAQKFDAAQQSGELWEFEKYRDDTLLELAKRGKADLSSVQPLIGYLMAKETEARAVRMVMTAKINRIPREVLRERLRGLYV